MIEPCCSFSFTAETHQRLLGIRVISQNALQRDDAARVSLAGAINDAHSATADLFEDLIIAQPPTGVAHIDSSQFVFKHFIVAGISVQTLMEQTRQTKTASDPRCRSTF